MHDMVHDFALSMTTNECFTIDVDKVLGIDWKSARHLTLEFNKKTQFPVSIYNAKNLRTLFLQTTFFERSSMVFSSDLFQHLTCLRSLNLKKNSIKKVPNEVEKLKHLRLLNLSKNTKITELPEMMCNLCNLQTLNISSCPQIKKLPQGMGKLIKLRHLLIDECYELTEPFPKGIGRLSSLRTLKKFIIGGINNIGECKLGELKNLVHLKGFLEIESLKNVTDVQEAENAELKKKIHLRDLRLCFGWQAENRRGENDELVLNALEPHPELENLWIYDYGGTGYPNWVMSLTILKKLELYRWEKLEQLPPLGKLRFLESLKIFVLDSVKKVGVEFLGIESNRKKDEEMGSTLTSSLILFPNLKSLTLAYMFEWEEWDGMGESGVSESVLIMPRLQLLRIDGCPKLKSLPNFLEKTLLEKLSVNCRIPNWMTLACNLPGLKSLTCSNLNNGEHFSTLGKLLFLESLRIEYCDRVKKVGVEFLGIEEESNNNNNKIDDEKGSTSSSSSSSLVLFPNLKYLEFSDMYVWEEWDGIGGTMREEEAPESGVTITIMPRLQYLTIHKCPKLKSLPDFLPTTPLKELDIWFSPILSDCCKTEIGDQWPKISHIPNIRINGTYVRGDGRPMQT